MFPPASCYDRTRGLFYFARMCSKIRLQAAGQLPVSYADYLGTGFDGRTCRYLRVTYQQIVDLVLAGATDEAALNWCFENGRGLTDEEILIFNSFMSKRGWRDDETAAFIPESLRNHGFPEDGTLVTDFDIIEMDEGRWHADQWRDAWNS